MRLKKEITPTLRSIGKQLGLKIEYWDGRLIVIPTMWGRSLSTESVFCKALVACGYLTERQMQHATQRYRLGATRSGGVIFWQIDEYEDIYNGKVMYYRPDCHRDHERHPDWVGAILTRRYQWADADRMTSRHCLFGQHLLEPTPSLPKGERMVAVVESEKTAVIMSEHYPEFVWLATGGMGNVQPDKFRPLRNCKVILFPDTDLEGIAYRRWYDAAQLVMQQPFWEGSPPIYVSPILEQQATSDQKRRKIDIADYYFERRIVPL